MQSIVDRARGRSVLLLNDSPLNHFLEVLSNLGIQHKQKKIEELVTNQKLAEAGQKLIKESLCVIILDGSVEHIKLVEEFTHKQNVPLVICGRKGDKIALMTNLGERIVYEAINCGVLSEEGLPVHVGTTASSAGQLCSVTTDGAHNLEVDASIVLAGTEYIVLDILSDNVFCIHTSQNIPQGSEVLLIKKSSWPTEHQSIDQTGMKMMSTEDCENYEICGVLAHHLINILLTPGLIPVQRERHIKSAADIQDETRIAIFGETSSYVAQYIKQFLNCELHCFSEKDEKTDIDYNAYTCVICVGGSFDYRQKLGSKCLALRKPLIVLSQAGLTGNVLVLKLLYN
jgi:hypothetical protein